MSVASFVLALAAAAGVAPGAVAARGLYWQEAEKPPVESLVPGAPDFAALARLAQPSVVSIVATPLESKDDDSGSPAARDFFERFYGAVEPPTKGMASGFVIRSDGYIVTNGHVVEDTAAISVTLGAHDQTSYPATVVGRDDLSDLALIRIDAGKPLPALALGASETLQVGDWVAAIGNPFGLAHSVTVGVVSFIGRRDVNPSGRPGYYDFIQTDASINPGNSGGPLLDRSGRVVGVSAAVNANGQGIGFCIPVDMLKDVLPALYEKGTVRRSFLGVSIQDLTPELAESFGVADPHGVVVTEVAPEGPARKAGVQVGDVIASFGGEAIRYSYRLRWLASAAGPGTRVALGIWRGGRPRELPVELGVLPDKPAREPFHRAAPPQPRPDLAPLGFAVAGQITTGPVGKGLRVVKVDANAAPYIAGLREGDLVLQAGETPVRAERDLQTAARSRKGHVLRLYIQRGMKPMFVAWRVP